MELRKEFRYRLGAPAFFIWEDQHRKRVQGEGISRDISLQGAFILTANIPPMDCFVQLDLLLPPISGLDATLRVTGRVKVIRVDRRRKEADDEKEMKGFAVLSDGRHPWGLTTVQNRPDRALVTTDFAELKPALNSRN